MRSQETPIPLLEMKGLTKAFGGVHALRGVDLSIAQGEVHALIGENGAGKSTLMKILTGSIKPDEGEMILDGSPYSPSSPLNARRSGISMVYQELNLAEHLTIEENLTLGIERTTAGFINRTAYATRIREALELLHHPNLTPTTRVSDISPAARQLVEIARGLITDNRLFVLDEPTSSLSHDDMERLFGVIDTLRGKGVSIIYISHFLEEVCRVADRFTVIRDGETIGAGIVADTPIDRIIELMVGRALNDMFPHVSHDIGGEILTLRHVRGKRLPVDATLTLHRGEILGIAGLVGSGRTELLRALFGLERLNGGDIRLSGKTCEGEANPKRMIQRGIAFLSEDRKTEGLAITRSIADNITLSTLGSICRCGFVGDCCIERVSLTWVDRLGIRIGSVSDPVENLSGGNQQKVALARLLQEEADVFLLDEPTRGVDVGSKVEIFRLIGDLAARGKAVIIVSSYLPELMGVCDTLAVMHRGTLGAKRPIGEWTEFSIMNEATSGA